MKTAAKLLTILFILSMGFKMSAQEQSNEQPEFKPVYITVTTSHWNDDPDTDFSDWMETEKEFFDKVTMKNDLIMDSGVYTHYFTPDNSEVVLVNVYEKWEDIEKANQVNNDLINQAWPDEEQRKSFMDKRSNFYSTKHSDEIYLSMNYFIPEAEANGEPRIFYVRNSELSMNGEGSPATFKEYYEKVTKKNKKLKGYYTHRHLWGSDSRQMAEVFVFDKLGDIEDFFDEEQEIIAATWTDEKEREDFLKEMGKNFTGKHADYVYRSVPELMKRNQ